MSTDHQYHRKSISINVWAWYIGAVSAWTFMVLALTIWSLPESEPFWLAAVITLICSPASWVLSGISGYWLAVGFDRATGLGLTLPGIPLAKRHPQSQALMGPILLIDVLLAIPLTLSFRNDIALCVKCIGTVDYGVVISGKPSGFDKDWYQMKCVLGTTSYKEARTSKQEAKWFSISELEICEDEELIVLS